MKKASRKKSQFIYDIATPLVAIGGPLYSEDVVVILVVIQPSPASSLLFRT
jgi:hypothetical protein